MKKKRLLQLKALLLATSLGLANPGSAYAGIPSTEEKTYGSEEYPEWLNKMIEFSEKTEQKIYERIVNPVRDKTDELREYDIDSLWLITDIPTKNPKEERHYYFVNGNFHPVKWIYYYDSDRNRVTKNDDPILREYRKMYPSITDLETVFRTEEWMDLRTNENYFNYLNWDDNTIVYDSKADARYIKFENIMPFLNEQDQKLAKQTQKLSITDLKRIEEYINDIHYDLAAEDLQLVNETVRSLKKNVE